MFTYWQKKVFLAFVFGVMIISHGLTAETYYVDYTNGNDVNNGQTENSPWKTIAKVNAANLLAGDIVLFKCNELWREELKITKSGTTGNPITFGKYGTGNNPLIKSTFMADDNDWELVDPVTDPVCANVSAQNSAGKQVWKIATPGVYCPFALLENGVRRGSTYFSRFSINVYDALLDLQTGYGGYVDYLYYRKDSGAPVSAEVGLRNMCILISGANNIIVDGIDCEGPGAAIVPSYKISKNIFIDENCSNIVIKNLELRYAHSIGISCGRRDGATDTIYAPQNVSYENITARDCGSTGIYHLGNGEIINCKSYHNGTLATDGRDDRGGIGIQGGNLLITGCEVYGNGRDDEQADFAISIFHAQGPIEITNCYIHDTPCGGIQFHSADGTHASNHLIAYNIIDRWGYSSKTGGTSGIFSAIRIQRVDGVEVYNNIFSNGGNSGSNLGVFARYSALDMTVKNNIFYNNQNPDMLFYVGTTMTGFESDNNIFYKTDYDNNWSWLDVNYDSLSSWNSGTGNDANSLTVDPDFVDSQLDDPLDFKLSSSSDAIDFGSDVGLVQDFGKNHVPENGTPDIGAWEYSPDVVNLITNSSFENVTANMPNDWGILKGSYIVGNVESDDTVACSGDYSVKVYIEEHDVPGGQYRSIGAIQVVDCSTFAGTEVTLSTWVKGSNIVSAGTAGYWKMRFIVYAMDSNSNIISYCDFAYRDGTFDWEKISSSYTVPANAVYLQVALVLSGCTGTAWFDNVVLSQ